MRGQPPSDMSSSLISSNSYPAGPSPQRPQPSSSMHAGSPVSVEKYLDSESDSADGSRAWDIDTNYRKIRASRDRPARAGAAAATAAAATGTSTAVQAAPSELSEGAQFRANQPAIINSALLLLVENTKRNIPHTAEVEAQQKMALSAALVPIGRASWMERV